jgi:hypothetical protein
MCFQVGILAESCTYVSIDGPGNYFLTKVKADHHQIRKARYNRWLLTPDHNR